MAKDVIIALDFSSKDEVFSFLDKFSAIEKKPFVKIGMELFYAEGPEMVRNIKARGHKIFLDLKLHDIPNTVKKTMAVLSGLDVDMTNLHAAGTKAMMEAALEGLTRPDGTRPLLVAVTQLCGLDGVVCSPLEAKKVHDKCSESFLTVTPGIRFADSQVGDQVRITTPAKAREIGSDYIVVGRPVTQAENPVQAYKRCVKEFLNEDIGE